MKRRLGRQKRKLLVGAVLDLELGLERDADARDVRGGLVDDLCSARARIQVGKCKAVKSESKKTIEKEEKQGQDEQTRKRTHKKKKKKKKNII